MRKFISDVWALISSLKLIYLLFSIFLYPSLAGIAYWVCDSTYLAQFGISPEMLSRPFFSNWLTNIWLITYSIPSIIYFWAFISFFFPLSLIAIINILKLRNKTTTQQTPNIESFNTLHLPDSFRDKCEVFFEKIIGPTLIYAAVFAIGVVLLVLLCFFYNDLMAKSKESAQKQITLFMEEDICFDRFDKSSVGCYGIPNEVGNSYLLIANDNSYLAYLDKGPPTIEQDDKTKKYEKSVVTIKNKKTGEKITRLFKKP